jgi:hypothetical protein
MRFSGIFAIISLFFSLGLSGCGGGGYSSDEAKQVCDLEAAKPCSDANSNTQCLSCYEECGADCAVLESCPVQYACPAE